MEYRLAQRKKGLSRCEFLVILGFLVFYLLPSVNASVPSVAGIGITVSYALYIASRGVRAGRIILKYMALIAFIAGCYFVLTQTSSISASVSYYHLKRFLSKFNQNLLLFFPMLLCYRVVFKASPRQKKLYAWASVAMLGYVMVNTYSQLGVNANATRSWANFAEQSENNIGTYAYVYAVSAFAPVLIQVICSIKQRLIKLLALFGLIFVFAFLLKAQYTLALLIAAVTTVMAVTQHIKSGKVKGALIAGIPFFLFVLPYALLFVADHVESEEMALRLREVSAMFSGGDLSGYNLSGRLTLYQYSLEYFLRSPIWGNRAVSFDGHATFLTVLSDLGLIGGIPLYYLYFSMKKVLCRIIGDKRLRMVFPSILGFWIMGFVNPIHSAPILGMVVWFVVPLLITTIIREND